MTGYLLTEYVLGDLMTGYLLTEYVLGDLMAGYLLSETGEQHYYGFRHSGLDPESSQTDEHALRVRLDNLDNRFPLN
jgi:hypothetical protein